MPAPTMSGMAMPLRKFHVWPVMTTMALMMMMAVRRTVMEMRVSFQERKTMRSARRRITAAGMNMAKKSRLTWGRRVD